VGVICHRHRHLRPRLTVDGFELGRRHRRQRRITLRPAVAIPKFLDISNSKINATGNGIVVADLDGDLLVDSNVISTGLKRD